MMAGWLHWPRDLMIYSHGLIIKPTEDKNQGHHAHTETSVSQPSSDVSVFVCNGLQLLRAWGAIYFGRGFVVLFSSKGEVII